MGGGGRVCPPGRPTAACLLATQAWLTLAWPLLCFPPPSILLQLSCTSCPPSSVTGPAQHYNLYILMEAAQLCQTLGSGGRGCSPSKNKPASLHNQPVRERVADQCQARVFAKPEFNVTLKIKKERFRLRCDG